MTHPFPAFRLAVAEDIAAKYPKISTLRQSILDSLEKHAYLLNSKIDVEQDWLKETKEILQANPTKTQELANYFAKAWKKYCQME